MASTASAAAAVSLLSLIEIKLHKDNYSEWKYMISPLLRHLDGLGHINGSTSCPNKEDDAAQYLDWVRKDTLLIMVIHSTLSQSISSVLPTALTETDYTCYTLWEFLKELCSTKAAPVDPFSLLLEDTNSGSSINRELGVEVEEDDKGMDFIRRYHKVASVVTVGEVLIPSEFQEKVKDFIKTKGWAVDSVDCKTKKEMRYMSPDGQTFSSLVKVCEYFINNSDDGVGSSEKHSKKRPRKSVKTVLQLQPAPPTGEEQAGSTSSCSSTRKSVKTVVQLQPAPPTGEEQAGSTSSCSSDWRRAGLPERRS